MVLDRLSRRREMHVCFMRWKSASARKRSMPDLSPGAVPFRILMKFVKEGENKRIDDEMMSRCWSRGLSKGVHGS